MKSAIIATALLLASAASAAPAPVEKRADKSNIDS